MIVQVLNSPGAVPKQYRSRHHLERLSCSEATTRSIVLVKGLVMSLALTSIETFLKQTKKVA